MHDTLCGEIDMYDKPVAAAVAEFRDYLQTFEWPDEDGRQRLPQRY